MISPHLSAYRLYFGICGSIGRRTNRWPKSLKLAGDSVHRFLRRYVFRDVSVMVRVKSGLGRGLWIRAQLPGEMNYWSGQRQRGVEKTLQQELREGSVFYDVGAHIGSVAFAAARVVGPSGKVVAFDPDPDNVISLQKGSMRNRLEDRVQVVDMAVWSDSSIEGIQFQRGAHRKSHGGVLLNGHRPVRGDGPTITVRAVTLDDFVANQGPAPQFVKVDVEGGEFEVLSGGQALFRSQRPDILVEVHCREAFEQIERWLDEVRYCARWEIPKEQYPRMLFAWPAESHARL